MLLLPLVLLCGCAKKHRPAQADNPSPTPPAPADGGGLQPSGIAAGIGRQLPSVGRVNPTNDLSQFALYYKEYQATGQSPSRLEDLPDVKRDMPKVYEAIQKGTYVVYWNAPVNASSDTILAYVSDAPTKGGVVALCGGSVINMTKEQFQAAPKAGK
jgi:hypothetical protein